MHAAELIRKEGFRRGLRNETIKTYITTVNKFLRIHRMDAREITRHDILKHLENLRKWNRAPSTINVHLNALKFFYEQVLRKKLTVNINFDKVRKRLPDFLTKTETIRLFENINNDKHKLVVKLLYATGMRVGELVKLKVRDFQFNQNYGWVRDGKGGKDRLFVVSKKLKAELMKRISENALGRDDWIFKGQGNSHYSSESVRVIIKKAARKSGIAKNVYPHTLRHSFATHLIENGYAITEVQPLLGHYSINTTMIYLHMASPQLLKVRSPYDTLSEKIVA
jgi:integrase/recombinase XerD